MQQETSNNNVSEDRNVSSGGPDIPATSRNGRSKWLVVLVAAALAAVTIIAYYRVANNDFICFDDPYYVTDNYHVKGGLSTEGTKWAFTAFYSSNWHPLTWLSHMLDVELFGVTPRGPHLVNLGYHVVNTLLLLMFLLYTTGRLWPSAFVAALFALHPLHVESVAWVSERKDVLSTFFWMLTMLSYAWCVRRPVFWKYGITMLVFALGLMAKPMLVTMPLVLLLLDYWPLERFGGEPPRQRRRRRVTVRSWSLVLEKVPFLGLSAASAVVTVLAQEKSINTPQTIGRLSVLTNAIVSCGRYAWKMIWPSNIALFYPHPHRPLIAGAIAVGILIVAATVIVLRYRRTCPYLVTGWLWYLITLIPVIGLIQVGDQSHADRYTYIPLTGLFIMVAWGAADILGRAAWLRPVAIAAGTIVLACSGWLTWQTTGYWKDSITLFSRAIAVTEDNAKMEASLGARLAEAGRVDEALEHLERSVQSKGNDGSAYNALGTIWLERGDRAKAIEYFTEATKYDWMNIKGEHNLGTLYVGMRRYDEAVPHLRRAVELNPYSAESYGLLAIALSETGRMEDAVKACDKAMELDPDAAIVQYARGYILAKRGKLEAAAEAYLRSIEIAPSYMAYGNLGNVLFLLGRLEDAAQSYRRAIELEPNKADAYYNLACMLDRMGRKDEAAVQVKRATEIDPNDKEAEAMYLRLTQ